MLCLSSALPWNHLWQPKEYSKKDHDKIAEKYHLHPKEYQPYPPDKCLGDYPNLPKIGPAAKDPYYPYDIPIYRKNYHETVNLHVQKISEIYLSCSYISLLFPPFSYTMSLKLWAKIVSVMAISTELIHIWHLQYGLQL